MLGELRADRDALPVVEAGERPLRDVAGDAGQALEILPADAAHQRAGRAIGRAGEGLALDQRQRKRHARDLADPIRYCLVVGQRRLDPLQEHVAVEADHLLHEVMPEAVHHRHDDDQRRDAEHDAEEGEPGDDGDRPLGIARAQIAERDHPFEGRKRPRRPRRRGGGLDGRGHAGAISSPGTAMMKRELGHPGRNITSSRRAWRSPPRCSEARARRSGGPSTRPCLPRGSSVR